MIIVAAAAAGTVVLIGVFFLGQSTGSTNQSGPTSLGAAFTAARTGSSPCGTTNEVTRRVLDRLCRGNVGGGTGTGGTGGVSGGAGLGGANGRGAGRALMVGTITSVSGSQVTVQTGQGPVTLTIGSDAAVRTITGGPTTDLTNGARVVPTNGAGSGTRELVVLGSGAGGTGAAGTTTPPSS